MQKKNGLQKHGKKYNYNLHPKMFCMIPVNSEKIAPFILNIWCFINLKIERCNECCSG